MPPPPQSIANVISRVMASGYRIRQGPDTPDGMSGPMLELISDSRSLLVGDLLGGVSLLAGLGGNFLGLVGLGEIAFLASLFGALGGSLSGFLSLGGNGLGLGGLLSRNPSRERAPRRGSRRCPCWGSSS